MMKRMREFTVTGVAVLFCAAAVLASPVILQAASDVQAKMSRTDRVEARINDLHSKLKITEAQEERWNKVAQVMRENAATMEAVGKARKEKKGMNAIDDLKSYSEITEAHAAGLKNFIAAFEDLYAGMSDDQKKTADQLFTKLGNHHKKSRKK
jgi:periplasmic protein CpxP/Spy